MPKKQSEADIEKEIVDYVESLGGEALKLRIDGRNGWHDRTIILPRVPAFTVEVKKPGGDVSDSQKFWVRRLDTLGMLCFVVDNLIDAKKCIDAVKLDVEYQYLCKPSSCLTRCIIDHCEPFLS